MSQSSIAVAMVCRTVAAPAEILWNYLEMGMQECLCLLFGNSTAGILFLEKPHFCLFVVLHSG